MKVTSQILSSDYSQKLKFDSGKDTKKQVSKESGKVQKDNSEDVLSITQENRKALDVSLKSLSEAIEKLNQVKTDITDDPLTALSAQGNILPESINSLI